MEWWPPFAHQGSGTGRGWAGMGGEGRGGRRPDSSVGGVMVCCYKPFADGNGGGRVSLVD